jgi:hypothetical protein
MAIKPLLMVCQRLNKGIHIAIVRFGFLVSHGYSLRSR